jgi:hypothetical protein
MQAGIPSTNWMLRPPQRTRGTLGGGRSWCPTKPRVLLRFFQIRALQMWFKRLSVPTTTRSTQITGSPIWWKVTRSNTRYTTRRRVRDNSWVPKIGCLRAHLIKGSLKREDSWLRKSPRRSISLLLTILAKWSLWISWIRQEQLKMLRLTFKILWHPTWVE